MYIAWILVVTSNHTKGPIVMTCGFDRGRECASERRFRIEIRDTLLVRVSVRTLRRRIIIGKFRDQGNISHTWQKVLQSELGRGEGEMASVESARDCSCDHSFLWVQVFRHHLCQYLEPSTISLHTECAAGLMQSSGK